MRCSTCSLHGKPCPQKDDAAGVIEKMVAADVIVLPPLPRATRAPIFCNTCLTILWDFLIAWTKIGLLLRIH